MPPLLQSYEAARRVTQTHAKSFYFCSFGLPQEIRRHSYAVYACCRTFDDEIDDAADPSEIPDRVAKLRTSLDNLYRGTATTNEPAWADAFRTTAQQCDIPKAFFSDLLTGVEMDQAPVRLQAWPELERYCYHVAGVVGLMMTRVFQLKDRRFETEAVKLGEAMQLTNILRDVAEDLRMDRVYLPSAELQEFGLSESFLREGRVTPEWIEFMKFQIARARAAYQASEKGIAALDRNGCQLTVWMMHQIYGGILGRIEKANYDVFTGRRFVPLTGKFSLAFRAWQRSRAS
jgi:phytoene synthase